MTQHSAASHRARVRKQEADQLQQALELEISRHTETKRKLFESRADLVLSRAAHDICKAELSDTRDALRVTMAQAQSGREFMADIIAMLKRHGIEV